MCAGEGAPATPLGEGRCGVFDHGGGGDGCGGAPAKSRLGAEAVGFEHFVGKRGEFAVL